MGDGAPPDSVDLEGGVELLLAHHGTPGARCAEDLALRMAVLLQARVAHLLVVPAFWEGMMGDDWLNNAATRDAFGSYLENLLSREAQEVVNGVRERCSALNLGYRALLRQGEVTEILLRVAEEIRPAMVVIGPRRPGGVPGFRDRVRIEGLARRVKVPVLIAPWGVEVSGRG
ncbi:MAG: universal stress protein [Magnetococcales bacterium]|nr:universal stress protein [Magnetococcales bacterium]